MFYNACACNSEPMASASDRVPNRASITQSATTASVSLASSVVPPSAAFQASATNDWRPNRAAVVGDQAATGVHPTAPMPVGCAQTDPRSARSCSPSCEAGGGDDARRSGR